MQRLQCENFQLSVKICYYITLDTCWVRSLYQHTQRSFGQRVHAFTYSLLFSFLSWLLFGTSLSLCSIGPTHKTITLQSLQESSIYSNFKKRQLFAFKMNVFSKCTKLNYSKILKVSFLWEEAVALKRTMLVWTVVSTVCSLILAFSGNLMKLKLVNRAPTLSTGPKSPSSSSSNLKT